MNDKLNEKLNERLGKFVTDVADIMHLLLQRIQYLEREIEEIDSELEILEIKQKQTNDIALQNTKDIFSIANKCADKFETSLMEMY